MVKRPLSKSEYHYVHNASTTRTIHVYPKEFQISVKERIKNVIRLKAFRKRMSSVPTRVYETIKFIIYINRITHGRMVILMLLESGVQAFSTWKFDLKAKLLNIVTKDTVLVSDRHNMWRYFVMYWAMSLAQLPLDALQHSLAESVSTLLHLESQERLIFLNCAFHQKSLSKNVKESIRSYRSAISDFDASRSIRFVGTIISALAKSRMLFKKEEISKSRVLVLGFTLATVVSHYVRRKANERWKLMQDGYIISTETNNNAYLRKGVIVELATRTKHRRELFGLNLQEYLLKEFNKARSVLGGIKVVQTVSSQQPENVWSRLLNFSRLDPSQATILTFVCFHAFPQLKIFSKIGSISQLLSVNELVSDIRGSLHEIIASFNILKYQTYAITAFFEVDEMTATAIKDKNERDNKRKAIEHVPGPMKIEVKNLSFTYKSGSTPALKNVSFTINPGEIVAVCGENGSGKSTLFSLLARQDDVNEGSILINDVPLDDCSTDEYEGRASFCFQSAPAMPVSLKEFVGLGSVAHIDNDEQILAALKASGGLSVAESVPEGWHSYVAPEDHDFYELPQLIPPFIEHPVIVSSDDDPYDIEQLNDEAFRFEHDKEKEKDQEQNKLNPKISKTADIGLQTGESDYEVFVPSFSPEFRVVSGGQWQRLTLAQSLMKPEPELICLDEPGAALDPEAEIKLFNMLFQYRGKATVLFITHRYNVTAKADKILVFDKGELIEVGNHSELISIPGGKYRDMWNVQASGFLDAHEQSNSSSDAGV